MKKFFSLPRRALLLALLLPGAFRAAAQTPGVGIGTTVPDVSAALDIVSGTKGALLPRLTSTQRAAIAAPATGLLVFQTNGGPGFYYNQGTPAAPQWLRLTDSNGVRYDPTTGLQVGPGPVGLSVAGTNVAGSTSGPGPFLGSVASARTETLYSASYLLALGLQAGPFSAISYSVTAKSSTQPYSNFTVALANSPLASLGTAFSTAGLVPVYSGTVALPASGLLTLPFNGSAFVWDGTSSVVVQTCFQNATASNNDLVRANLSLSVTRRLFATGSSSQCGAAAGSGGSNWPQAAFAQNLAYALPPTSGTAGQVLTQQASGAVAFADPQWEQAGTTLYPRLLTSTVGIGTPTPTQALDVNGQLRVRGLSGTGTRLPTVLPDGTLGVSAAPVYGAAASQPALPTAISGSVSVGNGAQRVAVSGTTAFVVNATDNTLQAFDVANPASPVLLGSIGTGNAPVNLAVSGTTVYVVAAGGDLLQIFGMGNPASPVLLGSIGTGLNNPRSVAVSGTTAYVVSDFSLQTFDVANPVSPVLLSTLPAGVGSFPQGVAVSGPTAYVVNSGTDALQVFDVSNPASPVLRGSIGTGDQPYDVAVRGTTAFVVNRLGSTLQAFGVANPASPVLLGSIGTGGGSGFPQSLAVGGTTAYVVSESSSTLDAFDVSNPASLVLRGSVSTGTSSFPRGVAVSSTAAYVVCSGGGSTLRVFAFPGPPRAVAVNADGSLASVPLPGGADFIQNQTAAVQAGGFNLSGNGAVGGTLLLNSADADKVYLTSAGANGSKIGHAGGWGVLNYAGPGTGSQGFHAWYTSGAGAYAERLRLTAAGTVGIGTSTPAGGLHVTTGTGGISSGEAGAVLSAPPGSNPNLELRGGSTAVTPYIDFAETNAGDFTTRLLSQGGVLNVSGAGSAGVLMQVNGGLRAVSYANISDRRFKQNIRPLAGALAAVRALRGVRYEWNALGVQRGGTAGAGQVGLIAQELEALYPELVITDAAGYKSVNYAQLAPVLIEALKEQQQQLEALQARAAADHASLQTVQQQLARLLGEAAPAGVQARR